MFFQSLFVDGDFDRVPPETVDGVHKYDIPRHGFFAIGKHLLKSRAMVVRTRHSPVGIGI